MTLRLDTLTLSQCEKIRIWRNDCLESLRTPYPLTEEQQEQFYWETVQNPGAPHRYWAIMWDCGDLQPEKPCWHFAGMAGLTHIQRENRLADISLILDPQRRDQGYGKEAVALILEVAFGRMGLKTVFGECYECSRAVWFWKAIAERYGAYAYPLRNRKFWNGEFHDAYYFSIDVDDWRKVVNDSK